MKIGFRKPSLKKRIAARTSVKRMIAHSLGVKAPRGYGWITNPKKTAYNRVYNRTTVGCMVFIAPMFLVFMLLFFWSVSFANDDISNNFIKCAETEDNQ